ncbi:hypothetical protein WOLCODRAFT_140341 [Wolfiporia cocos MD-104 SS10]|uniref:Uncharacterized protein n=1 Tax=Wolfiporia cocos (strain MD-104) TaxID=742152 RepID=A0A2H3J946_WOLCO|nr:hypothetical protein WOLCODRAFT_140341 [Wolfiporia cocos MD-104 SS10]
MGRPLFSRSHQTPAVRVEPEQPHPTYEKWTYWNAFDPDADEFFENDNAVYEAVVDPTLVRVLPPLASTASSSSSEASSSGASSPTEESSEESLLAERRRLGWAYLRTPATPEEQEQGRPPLAPARRDAPLGPAEARTYDVGDQAAPYASVPNISSGPAATQPVRERVLPPPTSPVSAAPAPDFHLPIQVLRAYTDGPAMHEEAAMHSRGVAASQPSSPVRSVTPPNQAGASYSTPSLAPSVTPRLYSWANRQSPYPTSPVAPRGSLMSRTSRRSSNPFTSPAPVHAHTPRIVL